MDKEIKLKISLDSNNAAEDIKKLDEQVSGLIKKLTQPVKPDIQPPTAETISYYKNLKLVINELHEAAGKPVIILNEKEREVKFNPRINTGLKLEYGRKGAWEKAGEEYTAYQKKITETEKKYSSQRQKLNFEEYSLKLAGMKTMFMASEVLFSKQTALYKMLSMAEAAISTYNAANAALLPPPIGAGPILGEIQAGLVIMNGLKRVEKIAAEKIPGYAGGGIVIGERGPEVIENMQDYAAGRAELVQKTILAVQKEISGGGSSASGLAGEIKNLRNDIKAILGRPAVAYLDDKEAKKIYYRGNYFARKTR